MPESSHDTIKIDKLFVNPKKGYKLGTTSATWKKIKLAATDTSSQKPSDCDEPTFEGVCDDPNSFVHTGPNGELIILHQNCDMEVWNWCPSNDAQTKVYNGDTLYLHSQENVLPKAAWGFSFKETQVESFVPFPSRKLLNTLSFVLVLKDTRSGTRKIFWHSILLHNMDCFNPIVMEVPKELLRWAPQIKISESFVVVAFSEGFIYPFTLAESDAGHPIPVDTTDATLGVQKPTAKTKTPPLIPGNVNTNFKLHTLKQTSSQPILTKYPSLAAQVSDESIVLKTSCFDGRPIFDLVGNWLVYSPTKDEYDHLKNVANGTKRTTLLTPVKLPPPGPLLTQVVSSLSNSALDGLFKLSEFGTKKVRGYMKKASKKERLDSDVVTLNKDVVIPLNSIGKAIGLVLYSTASTIQKTTQNLKKNEIIKVVDLSNGQTLSTFKPPGGISMLSLSPYDLQLVQANFRGDTFYMWDLYKSPDEVSLIGKFLRGKTSAVITEIFWFINNNSLPGKSESSTNLGFGCITKKTGSIHWYNVNYLAGGNSSGNSPNTLGAAAGNDVLYDRGEFLDSWILSTFKAKRFIALPNCSNFMYGSRKDNATDHYLDLNQLAIIDDRNQLKLLSPLNGYHGFKYQLPAKGVRYDSVRGKNKLYLDRTTEYPHDQQDEDVLNPLSQAEIETCTPYLNLVNDKNVQFATYDTDITNFFTTFGDDLPVKVVDFGECREQESVDDDMLKKLNEGLVIEQADVSLSSEDSTEPLI